MRAGAWYGTEAGIRHDGRISKWKGSWAWGREVFQGSLGRKLRLAKARLVRRIQVTAKPYGADLLLHRVSTLTTIIVRRLAWKNGHRRWEMMGSKTAASHHLAARKRVGAASDLPRRRPARPRDCIER